MAEYGAAGGVEIGAIVRGTAQVLLHGGGVGVTRIHLAAKRLELRQRDVAGAALGRRSLNTLASTGSNSAGEKGSEHFAASSGMARMLVVV